MRRIYRSIYSILRDQRRLKPKIRKAYIKYRELHHSVAAAFPFLIQPIPVSLMVSITSKCNQTCHGCRYGRDFMPGSELKLSLVHQLLQDARKIGFVGIRLYGGEPLLHQDLSKMVLLCNQIGLNCHITTNGVLLEQKFDRLYKAGLRSVTIGFYGMRNFYDEYVQVPGNFARVERGISRIRSTYSDQVRIQMNWLLMRPTCNVAAFREACKFAERYGMKIQIDLLQYSVPYFCEGPNQKLRFTPEDQKSIKKVVDEMIEAKEKKPELFTQHIEFFRSIPDWLVQRENMKIPCTAYEMIWVGPDGTVMLCFTTFKLGNLYEKPLAQIFGTVEHRCAVRDAFSLNCPNCYCGTQNRILYHRPSRLKYSGRSNHTRR